MKEQINKGITAGVVVLVVVILGIILLFGKFILEFKEVKKQKETAEGLGASKVDMVTFASQDEFLDYLSESSQTFAYGRGGVNLPEADLTQEAALNDAAAVKAGEGLGSAAAMPERFSLTNVQVQGVDEPDILKTDGVNFYYARDNSGSVIFTTGREVPVPLADDVVLESSQAAAGVDKTQSLVGGFRAEGVVDILKAFPPEELAKSGEVKGFWYDAELLLDNQTLVVIQNSHDLMAYDVKDPANPEKKWEYKLDSRTGLVAERLYQGKLYLVTKTTVNQGSPCPFVPVTKDAEGVEVRCEEIYHPKEPVYAGEVYTVMEVEAVTGELMNKRALVSGDYTATTTNNFYMSKDNLYLAYDYPEASDTFILDFISQNKELFPDWANEKLEKLKSYDLSQGARIEEIGSIMERVRGEMTQDEILEWNNQLENRLNAYLGEHMRRLSRTGVIKVGLDDLKIKATGVVGGRINDQFSMDEYEGNLRVATTVSNNWGWYNVLGRVNGNAKMENDVYVLGEDLKLKGMIQGLGLDERIYSARFVGDRGYLVTFKQVDPFFVMDLSDPEKPTVEGELKIPGYSSYLHPLGKDLVVGIGKEGNQVKVSLFDVKKADDPKEVGKFLLDEYWSEILNTHHAFLVDLEKEIFFLPGGKGGYVFSYRGGELKLVKAMSGFNTKRAVYINDYLYVLSEEGIRVFDEENWEEVGELKF